MSTQNVDPTSERLTRPGGLAEQLRALREGAGLTGKDLALRAGWQASKVSRLELGRQRPTDGDLDVWASTCGASPSALAQLKTLLGEVTSIHQQWRRRMATGQELVQSDYTELVAGASVIAHFETVYIPGLLQTPDYARRVLTEMVDLHALSVADVDAAIAARLRRQPMLYDDGKRFEILLAEPVLHWRIAPATVMHSQLDRLQTVVGLPNVRFGILPLDVELPITPQNSFQLYDDIAIVETFIGESVYRGTEALAYARALERLWDHAITGQQARAAITRATDQLA